MKRLPRRTFLGGIGTFIALPVLDAMLPAFASAKETAALAKAPTRISFNYIPNGAIMEHWTPKGVGPSFEFTRILKPLEPFREDVLVLSRLAHTQANELGDGGGDHARAGACFLTGMHPRKTAGADISVGISADQIAAQQLAANSLTQTRLPSLELGCEDTRTVGNCDSGYSCAYTNSISWRGPATPMPPETNPRGVFERMFGSGDISLDAATRARRALYRKSILDLVQGDTQRLVRTLGPNDRRKIDEYLSAVREIERRIESAELNNRDLQPTMEKPDGIPIAFSEYLKLMYDLQVMAFRSDLTRVTTLMVGREGSVRVYPEIGIADPHHPLTHHRNNPAMIEKIAQINCFHAQLFAYFLDQLKSIPDGDGSLLDHSMIVYASAISDGNQHLHENLPVLLAGRANGELKPGRHIVYPDKTPMANLYLSLLDRLGVHTTAIGDSTGRLEHLNEA
jgi:Protein of unknown function (DUF1552)